MSESKGAISRFDVTDDKLSLGDIEDRLDTAGEIATSALREVEDPVIKGAGIIALTCQMTGLEEPAFLESIFEAKQGDIDETLSRIETVSNDPSSNGPHPTKRISLGVYYK